ncbi:unnamed protein product [Eruca vesicaria subsp. sativa]|uniref:Uncharacterized protein n=1 Tax=Eruca vesicaria subsp. sativa TaxID=29727 RepID=A0ABC8JMT3_ERUVS|nr:unnamed protein product [Eruca vesicaria subsp. sativa]
MSNPWLHQSGASALKPSPLTAGEVPPPPLIPPDPPPEPSSPFSPQNYPPLGTPVLGSSKQSSSKKKPVNLSVTNLVADVGHQLRATTTLPAVPIGSIQCAIWNYC